MALGTVGGNWFTATLSATSVSSDATGVNVSFEPGGDQYRANDKVYLQGPHQLISEAGEWGLDSASATLYYWPRDAQAMEAGTAHVVACQTDRIFDFRGDGWEADQLARAIDVSGLVLSGSDFSDNFTLFTRTNDTPLRFRTGMVRFENATDCSLHDCALLDAGHSAVWMQGFAQNLSIRGNRIERPGFCGLYFSGIYPGDTWPASVGGDRFGNGTVFSQGPIASAAQADMNKGHVVTDNFVWDYGGRVGHGSGTFSCCTTDLSRTRFCSLHSAPSS